MTRIILLVTFFLLISIEGLGQCVNPPTVTLSSNNGTSCGTTPVTVSGNIFGGGASKVTIKEDGGGTVSPTSATTSPFSFTYSPKSGDYGKTVTITVTTDKPAGPSCTAAKATYTLTVNANPSPPITGTINQPACSLATGSVVLSGLPSTGTWTIIRTPGEVISTGSGTNTTISDIPPGSYTFKVADSAQCTSTESANAIINAQPTSPASPTQTVDCTLGSGKAVVTMTSPLGSGLQYRIDGGAFQSGTSFTNVADGDHTITVSNSSGCTTTGTSFQVLCGCVNPPTVTLGSIIGNTCGTTPLTVNGNTFGGSATSVTITENGAGTVSPNTSTILPFAFTYTPAAGDAGDTIIITVTTNNPLGTPCAPATATFTLTVNTSPSVPLVSTITQPTCEVATGSVVLSGLPATGTWTLIRAPDGVITTGSGTSFTVLGLVPGTYTYTVTNATGCISVASANVVINVQSSSPTAPVVGNITQPTCTVPTGNVVLSGLPATGTWTLIRSPGGITTPGSGTSTIVSGLAEGIYTFTVTNSAGCISPSSADVVVPAQPSIPSAPVVGTITQPTCTMPTGSVVLSGLPATGTWTLTRSPGGVTNTGTGTSSTISGLDAGIYTYTVTNVSGCISVTSSNVVINAQPSFPPAPVVGTITLPTCTASTGSVLLNGLPSSGIWTLIRTSGGITTPGSGTSTIVSNLAEGIYTFTVTNSAGCISPSSADVVIPAQPLIPAVPTVGNITIPTCTLPTGSVILNGLPGTGTWTLTRYPGTVISTGTGTSTTLIDLLSGTYNFTVTNAAGCLSSPSANVLIPVQPAIPTPPTLGTISQPTCSVHSGSVVLTGLPTSGNWTLIRSPDGISVTGSSASTTISGLVPGIYTYTVTNSVGCTSQASSDIVISTWPDTPTLIITNPAAICSTSKADLTSSVVTAGSTPGLTFTYWTDAGATIVYPIPSTADAGTFYIKGTSYSGCSDIKPVTVTAYPLTSANAGPDQVLEYVFETNLDAEPAGENETGVWSLISGTGVFFDSTYAKTSVNGLSMNENKYLWTVTNGVCPAASDTVIITVHDLVIPTLITPNMDGKNDYFVIRGLNLKGKVELVVFDRNGVQVYKNGNYNNLWNGVDYNGDPLADGTYFYVIQTENGKSVSGYIVIRR
jgi:gliding motility-associated-like protein